MLVLINDLWQRMFVEQEYINYEECSSENVPVLLDFSAVLQIIIFFFAGFGRGTPKWWQTTETTLIWIIINIYDTKENMER